ncbi:MULTISPECIES: LysR family transcriptional regulator [unclassified Variovorax]|jgi:DNA-binding transcriptional LysR family regulator|uniref:LysR family transcriptional regulator n=1 Tax=unclassified Variovorax TaxID=663243 RepID=UPI000F7E439F|nr:MULTISPECIES: LysR family transcriptional regulator [unclassified Variovorax]RSZ33191.1 LysR family transcriptional regulator [Variovorax sp. 553]RSZ33562.1 LysR family transcriptional regulator [Variovorax sp. 679]
MFIRQLSYVVALAQEKHFGRAAAACNVSQPALSGAIRGIEQELGVVIVQRGRRFEGFTKDGERVLAWARRVLADCENLRQDARASEDDPVGTLRMGVIPASLPLVPMLTQCCLQRYPRMRHEIFTLSATEILRKIEGFELDLGLSYLDDDRLDAFATLPIFRERYVFVAAEKSMLEGVTSMSWSEAAGFPLCLFTTNMQCRRGMDAAFAAAGVEAVPQVETDSMTALWAHVRRAGLYSILPHSVLCLTEPAQQLCSVPMAPQLQRDIGLVLSGQLPRAPLLDAAMRQFRELDLQGWVDGFLPSP